MKSPHPRPASYFAFACASLAFVSLASFGNAAGLPTPDPDNGGIALPPGFRAVVFADNLVVNRQVDGHGNNLRFLAVAPNGDVYAKTKRGSLLALRDTDGDGRADVVKEFGEGGGSGLMFHDGWLYHSTDKDVYRYKYTPGELVPSGPPEHLIVDLPNQRQHESKAFFFDDAGALFVESGSPSNSYGGENDRRLGAKGSDATQFLTTFGGFWRYDPAKQGQKQTDGYHYSTGHRHVVGVAWNPVSHSAFFTMNGRDNLHDVDPDHYSIADGAELPAEEFHQLKEGLNVGWPYTYYDPLLKARMVSPEFGGDGKKRAEAGKYPDPIIAFPAHWAPLQMAYYGATQFPAKYRGGMFVAFHGSWNRAPLPQRGYNVCFIPFDAQGHPTGKYEIFADGFAGTTNFTSPNDARFRPCGLAVGPDGSLYVGDTEKGRIWRIFYTGDTTAVAASTTVGATADAAPGPEIKINAKGRQIYDLICATCHMADGGGVPNMQPSLKDSLVVRGDSATMIRAVLHGPAVELPADRQKYSNVMPPFAPVLDDVQLADVLTYVRQNFGHNASAVTSDQVKAQRP
ncbi:MAG TPA: c-type cytochrome [Candidatus Didemnitutus sp.]|nr:c-type cytochrome [Candidatus Didemnitutus sp.]